MIHLPITMSSRSKDRLLFSRVGTYLEKKDPVLLIFGLNNMKEGASRIVSMSC